MILVCQDEDSKVIPTWSLNVRAISPRMRCTRTTVYASQSPPILASCTESRLLRLAFRYSYNLAGRRRRLIAVPLMVVWWPGKSSRWLTVNILHRTYYLTYNLTVLVTRWFNFCGQPLVVYKHWNSYETISSTRLFCRIFNNTRCVSVCSINTGL